MADGLIEILIPRLPSIKITDLILVPGNIGNARVNKWVKIYDTKELYTEVMEKNCLELRGSKVNIVKEKEFDIYYSKKQATALINKNMKMWLAKLHTRRLKIYY